MYVYKHAIVVGAFPSLSASLLNRSKGGFNIILNEWDKSNLTPADQTRSVFRCSVRSLTELND